MATAKDFKQDEENDILINNGDFVVFESDQQHILDIIYSAPNWFKEFPQLGVNIQAYLSGGNAGAELTRNIQLQLQSDGYKVNTVKLNKDGQNNYTLDTDAIRL